MGKASRVKGAGGERECVKFLSSLGFACTRSKQGGGSDTGPDVLAMADDLTLVVESKRYRNGWSCVYPGLEQAEAWSSGSVDSIPVLRLKHDRRDAMIIMKEADFARMLDILRAGRDKGDS